MIDMFEMRPDPRIPPGSVGTVPDVGAIGAVFEQMRHKSARCGERRSVTKQPGAATEAVQRETEGLLTQANTGLSFSAGGGRVPRVPKRP